MVGSDHCFLQHSLEGEEVVSTAWIVVLSLARSGGPGKRSIQLARSVSKIANWFACDLTMPVVLKPSTCQVRCQCRMFSTRSREMPTALADSKMCVALLDSSNLCNEL